MKTIAVFKKPRHDIFRETLGLVLGLLFIAAAGALAYRNTLNSPFIFDDMTQIVQNEHIRSWHWPWSFIENNRRPFLYATLAFNFHFSGLNPFGYHLFNISVHILAAMMFFLLVRKTLLFPAAAERFRRKANVLALSAATLWLLHPIHTQAVTYLIQRAESLMGLFFLSTLYFSSKYFTSRRHSWIMAAAVTSLLAGLTKEVALVLPFMIFFYDRTFISVNSREALKNNRWLYASLSLTWAVMFFLYLTTNPEKILTAGFGLAGMTPLQYVLNQPPVILHYVRLAFWPEPLVFDYDWPPVQNIIFLWPAIAVVLSWIVVLVVAYKRFPVASFLGLSFFILLLPSSSILPLKDLVFEYRLYLPLACGAVAFVLLLKIYAEKFIAERKRQTFFVVGIVLSCLVLGGLTYQRNKTYANEEKVWLDVIRKQPSNSRAYNNLGEYWLRRGRESDAKDCFMKALVLNPNYPDVYANMTVVLGKEGKVDEAIQYAKQAVVLDPDFAIAYNNWGSALSQAGRYAEAVPYFKKTLALGCHYEGVFANLVRALDYSGQIDQAKDVLKQGLGLYPDSPELKEILKARGN